MTSEEPRVGVYICHCGTNIAGVVDIEKVADYVATLPNVPIVKHYMYMCSAPAQEMIQEDIKNEKLNRIVVASCSPRMHEPTFRAVVEEGGLNPYLYEQANIRESCSWVHMHEPKKATEKACDLIRMAVAKARLLEPLKAKEVGVTNRVLVIGGGIAGLRASLDLAQRGFNVHLVEKAPTIGGKTAQLSNLTYTGKLASEILKSLIDEVISNGRITIHTSSEVSNLEGYIGNFTATIAKKPRHVNETCTACGKCEEICPIDVPDEYRFGLETRKAIHLPYSFAFPPRYVIDVNQCNSCGKCLEVCESNSIDLEERLQEEELDIGTIIVTPGFDLYEPSKGEYGYGVHKNVITLFQLERVLDETASTKIDLALKKSNPKNIVFILCVGSRQEKVKDEGTNSEEPQKKPYTYCSRICCAPALKDALLTKERYPESNIFILYRDIRTYGRDEKLYTKALENRIRFVKYKHTDLPKVVSKKKRLEVKVYDVLSDANLVIPADLIVLSVGATPRKDISEIQSVLHVVSGADGFLQEVHPKLNPLETANEGMFIAGCGSGPKNITESIASASGAAAKAAIPLARGKVELEPTKAVVIKEACDGCAFCIDPCVGKAITLIEYEAEGEVKKTIELNEALCKGCGICQATCPKKGIIVKHFTHDQIAAMIMAAITER